MYLCDTNVISEFVRHRPSARLLDWAEGISAIFVSSATIEEIYYGLSWKPNQRVSTAIEAFIAERCELLPVDAEIAKQSGLMRGVFQARGITRSLQDMLIAATAQIHHLTLVTRNVRDFEDCAIAVFNPID